MSWVEITVVFFVSHEVGDYLLQTEWQAAHKRGGLRRDPIARRALVSHTATYTAAFIPAFVWLAGSLGAWTVAIVALVALPHMIQDDRRLLDTYIRAVKHRDPRPRGDVEALVDQAFHFATLFGVALLAHALS
jgi:hypothetical protein